MKKISIVAILILLLLSGCTKSKKAVLHYELDSDGSYTGFRDLPVNYTAQQAEKDGCYVRVNSEAAGGEQLWKDFIRDASDNKEASIRIVNIWDDDIYYKDLYYINGYYHIFDSSSEDLSDHSYKYMLTLEGTLPNAAKSGKVTILTDDKNLTYKEVMWTFLSSDSRYSESISPFRFVFFN